MKREKKSIERNKCIHWKDGQCELPEEVPCNGIVLRKKENEEDSFKNIKK